ncbi:MAG TPA: peptidoglycan-associated lipoprotein Pal [Gemmatimonadota bacterium]|nr:peptidoglycan-associated lipoprotein Pal [Gemmatimonadota bacterium]
MTTTRWTVALALVLAVLVAATGCSKKQVETTPDRDRMDPGAAATDTGTDEAMTDDSGTLTRDEALAMIGDMIFFDFDRSELRPEARTTLQQKSEILRQYPDIRVRIEGHADERGTVEYNLALGERRADSARTYLIDLGIDPDRLTTISYGEERPLAEGHNEAAWQQNRRDEFIPIP